MKLCAKDIWIPILRDLTLWNFAVAYPVYDVLCRSPEFFTAHRASGLGLVLFLVAVSLLGPLALAVIEIGVGLLSTSLKRAVAVAVSQLLIILTVLQFVDGSSLPTWAQLGVAIVASGLIINPLLFTTAGRRFVLALSPIALLAPGLVWFDAAVKQALIGTDSSTAKSWVRANGTPVVLLIFDQLPTSALIDSDHEIDVRRWPALAKFLRICFSVFSSM